MKSKVLFGIALCLFLQSVRPVAGKLKVDTLSQTNDRQAVSRKAGEIVIEAASITTAQGEIINFDLGTLYVPENRSDPKSRVIGVGFARFRAMQPSNAPPTFHLPGGPGESLLKGLQPGNNTKQPVADIETYRRISDVVYIDQRGATNFGDVLKVRYRTTEHPLDQPISIARAAAGFTELSKNAVAEFTKKGFDLRGYNIKECAEDVNDLRKALGYERITLVGQSFGSQWCFAVMRVHPEIVARALLSGVEPLDFGYDMPSHVFAAVQRMWWEAEKDPQLKPYLPAGGLMQVAREVLQRLDRAPIKVTVKDQKSGEETTITLGKEDLQRNFPTELDGPAFLLSLYYGHYDAWARMALSIRRSRETDGVILGALIDTGLGVTRKREYLLRQDPAAEFLGHWNFNHYLATADIWPTPDVGDDFRTEVLDRIPVVFVQGDWDTSTPIENTFNVAPYFPNGRVLIVEHGRHSTLKAISQYSPETMAALLEFVKTGSTEKLPNRITLPVPKFDPPNFPPQRRNSNRIGLQHLD